MEAEFRILCGSIEARQEVKRVMKRIGFYKFRDLDDSPLFDISARLKLDDCQAAVEVAEKIFEKCDEDVQTIDITPCGLRSWWGFLWQVLRCKSAFFSDGRNT